MAVDSLVLEVRWSPQRSVTVNVKFQPTVGPSRRGVPKAGFERLDGDDLTDKPTLLATLSRITRSEPAGGVVEARCVDFYASRFLELLDIQGPPPVPVVVELEA